jgi:GNAT superfamily N-acetyltransferase
VSDTYRVRAATLDDADALVHHRIAMFTDMGLALDAEALARAFRGWLLEMLPGGTYRAWVVETSDGRLVGGGGMTILPWPPGPRSMGDRLAFVYNVYVEPTHRRHGLARLIMETIHGWCREAGVASVALNASRDGLPLYEAMGYQTSPAPMMFFPIVGV